MDKRQKECLARLCLGFALNIPLYFVVRQLGRSSTIEREVSLILTGGTLAAAAAVFVLPVFWRALPRHVPWQVPLAFVLIFYLPGFTLVSVVATRLHYW